MLDTNIVSELARNPNGACARKIREVGDEGLCVSVVTSAELRFGVLKRGAPRLQRQIEAILDAVQVVPLEPPVDAYYARIRHELEQHGMPIGPNDLLIAAHACALSATLITANIREFKRVQGLVAESWLV